MNSFLNNLKHHFLFGDFIILLKLVAERKAPYAHVMFFKIIGSGIKNKYPDKVIDDEELLA